jgi:hypothetical protein
MTVEMVYRTETGRVPVMRRTWHPIDIPAEDVTPIDRDAVPAEFIAHAEVLRDDFGRLNEVWATLGHHLDRGEIDYVHYAARIVDGAIEFGLENVEA